DRGRSGALLRLSQRSHGRQGRTEVEEGRLQAHPSAAWGHRRLDRCRAGGGALKRVLESRHAHALNVMTKNAIHTPAAPAAIGPYSQAIRAGDTIYLSGQIGLDPTTGNLRDGLEAQARQVLENLRAVAAAGGGTLDDIVKLTLLLADMTDFAKV